jgi:hypothetical protein
MTDNTGHGLLSIGKTKAHSMAREVHGLWQGFREKVGDSSTIRSEVQVENRETKYMR